ncbi:GNAT family N-acetyltransferase [Actinacidiphila acidipaludis]|uniref:N-acetyltransferase n=1 Tax=Actinacidiphila acidipaludis TaxID=2873382 RepID=A0ABS7Q0Y8_9ACTN|nr:GNAT family N-acetyltransferase [Streptomyces acidipaludis]MBY8876778.1 N-acetyltransferase [Streptomyces acidipaludis]
MSTPDVTVTDVPDARRYEARIGGELAGMATYMRTPDMIVFVHTEVESACEGHGVGSVLARTALDEARELGLRVVAICPFIDGWMQRHPEYEDLRFEPASRVAD